MLHIYYCIKIWLCKKDVPSQECNKQKISNVALLTFEGAAFNVTFLALLLILVYPLTMVLKQEQIKPIYLFEIHKISLTEAFDSCQECN
jgi:hypothetical protein